MGLLEPRPEDHSRLPESQLVLDGRIVGSVSSLRPMAWVDLEAVALAAHLEDDVLVAHTSARQLAQRLGLDPGTAAAALRLLRRRGLLELRRSVGETGRFGLSAYVLGDVAELGLRPCVGSPAAVPPPVEDPHTQPGPGSRTTITKARPNVPARSRPSSPSSRTTSQGAFDLRLEDHR